MNSAPDTAQVTQLVDDNMDWAVSQLGDLVAIDGLALDSYPRETLERSASAVEDLFSGLGLETQVLTATVDGKAGGPAIVARRKAAAGKPTVLLYAHHDVQPSGDEDAWTSAPFTMTERDGRLYGRGVADDKGGIMVHAAALKALAQLTESNGVGITVFIEGEEEAGSPTFGQLLDEHRELLRADVIIVTDAGNVRTGVPTLTTSLRGLVDGTVRVRTLEHSVHSGQYGGPVLDALTVLCQLLATMHDDDGAVAIDGLVRSEGDPGEDSREHVAQVRADSSVLDSVQLAGRGSLNSRMWHQPALSVIGIDAPSVAKASNTLLAQADAKVSLRLAPGQDPQVAMEALRKHVEANAPFGAQVEFIAGESGVPFQAEGETEAVRSASSALEDAFGQPTVTAGMGGSIPFVADLKEAFPDAQILLTGVADPDTRAHGIDESMDIEDFRKAITAETLFLSRL